MTHEEQLERNKYINVTWSRTKYARKEHAGSPRL